MKKLLTILCILCTTLTYGQKSVELGFSVGASSYLGDLKEESYFLNQNNIALGLQGRYNFNSLLSARASFNYATISGDDSRTDRAELIARNLSFRSRIVEMALIGEFNFWHFGDHRMNKEGRSYHKIAPYIFGGVALFNFNPEARYKGNWYDLKDLGTEGQDVFGSNRPSYNLTQISIPVGGGLKIQLEPNVIVSVEVGWRKTFTDYLDDVSTTYYNPNAIRNTNGNLAADLSYRGDELIGGANENSLIGSVRGNPENDDWYIISNLTISYKLFRNRSGCFSAKY